MKYKVLQNLYKKCFFLCNLGVGSEGAVWFSEPAQLCLECGQEVRMDVMQSNDRGWHSLLEVVSAPSNGDWALVSQPCNGLGQTL